MQQHNWGKEYRSVAEKEASVRIFHSSADKNAEDDAYGPCRHFEVNLSYRDFDATGYKAIREWQHWLCRDRRLSLTSFATANYEPMPTV